MPGQIKITVKPSLSLLARKFGNVNINGFLQDKIKELAFLVERESKKVTPVDTGRLRASIGVSLMPLSAIVQPDTNYELYVHEGTKYMRARPFMLWGAQAAEKGFERKMSKDLESYIQRRVR